MSVIVSATWPEPGSVWSSFLCLSYLASIQLTATETWVIRTILWCGGGYLKIPALGRLRQQDLVQGQPELLASSRPTSLGYTERPILKTKRNRAITMLPQSRLLHSGKEQRALKCRESLL